MWHQVKFRAKGGEDIIGGIGLYDDDDESLSLVICGCCGAMMTPEDVVILEKYSTWIDLTETIVGDD